MDDDVDIGRRHAGRLENCARTADHAPLGRRLRGEDFDCGPPAVMLDRQIGEGPADIDGKSR